MSHRHEAFRMIVTMLGAPRQATAASIVAFVLIVAGCDWRSPETMKPEAVSATTKAPQGQAETDFFELAIRLREQGKLDEAADSVYKSLIQAPDNAAAKMLAAELEAERGKFELAAEITSSISFDSPVGASAIDLRVRLLVKIERYSEAADVLLAALDEGREETRWRHEAWKLLNHVGRREEASTQALVLCRMGQATEQQLLSLINQVRSFPTPEMIPHRDETAFHPGLGRARWFFSRGERELGLAELTDDDSKGLLHPAGDALFGRLLAESQRWDEFRRWSQKVTSETKRYSNYWAAIGTYLNDNRQYEGAARALLEAVHRDPTDRLSVQRLYSVLGSLGRNDDAEQFKFRGVEISNTEQESLILFRKTEDIEARKRLARQLMELDRPFETLAWTMSMLPSSAVGPRRVVDQQRQQLLQNAVAMTMASESALLGLERSDFDLESATRELLKSEATALDSRPPRGNVTAKPRLVDRASERGLSFQWYKDVDIDLISIPIHESLGGGIAVLDFDLDGWPDLYLAQGSGDPPTDRATRSNQLFRNCETQFDDCTEKANAVDFNYSSGIAAGDINQDGFPDLFLGSLGHNRLLVNNGDGTFQDASERLGDCGDRFTTSVAIADINGDRLPDLFEANYIEMEGGFTLPVVGDDGKLATPSPLSHYADSDRWFEQRSDGQFSAHVIGREIAKPGTALGLIITDFDSDGVNDIFVGNDVRPNHLLVRADQGFVNVADSKGVANGFDGVANGCMGIATGDFDRDGTLDLHIANYSLESSNLFLQTLANAFVDQSRRYGLAEPTYTNVGFGTKAADIDRNGFLDLIVTNGHIFDMRHLGEPYQMSPQLFMSTGDHFQLAEMGESTYWNDLYLGRAITQSDFDRDGDIDFFVGHLDKPLALLENETETSGKWLQLELVGTTSERDAIGAKVDLSVGQIRQSEWVIAGDGYLSSDESVVIFAFPATDTPAQIDVLWPSGARQSFLDTRANHRYLIIEGDAELHVRR